MVLRQIWLYFVFTAFALALDSQVQAKTHLTVPVSDEAGANVPKARIELASSGNDTASVVRSNGSGAAQLDLSPGTDQLSVENPHETAQSDSDIARKQNSR
jgi:hypothetical protein